MTLNWPPALRAHLSGHEQVAAEYPQWIIEPPVQDLPLAVQARIGLADPRLIGGIADITAIIAGRLDDGASAAEVMPVIRDTARRWLERQVRAGLLPASAASAIDELARAVHDQRYELGPVTAYLRDPQVENIDVNGCDDVWVTYASGERVAGPPVAVSMMR